MSGPEIIIVAAATLAITSGGLSAANEIQLANETNKLEKDEIRNQQVQLRIQENQQSLERVDKLRRTIATSEVMLGARNIGAGVGAIELENEANYLNDTELANLNFSAKQRSLKTQLILSDKRKDATKMQSILGFVKGSAMTAMSAAGGGLPTGQTEDAAKKLADSKTSGVTGAGSGTSTTSTGIGKSTIAPQGSTMGSRGFNSYFDQQFNLNR